MKRFILFAALLASLFVSCVDTEGDILSVIERSGNFTATIDHTRAELNDNAVIWNIEDQITIFTLTSHNRKYKITELSDDLRSATFGYVSHTGTDDTNITTNYALYPYDANATLTEGVITTSINPTQVYGGNTLEYAIMAAAASSTNFAFKNACALMHFKVSVSETLADTFMLNSITLSTASKAIAGEATIDLNGSDVKAIVTSNGTNEIILSDIDTEIDSEVKDFYAVVPATTFDAQELTVTFSFENGSKSFELPAFELHPGIIKSVIYEIKDTNNFDDATLKPANNEIWYTSSDGNIVEPHKTNIFGANIISNTYIDGKGIITFDGNVTKIGNFAFDGCSSLTSITIPDSVTSMETKAFHECSNLTSITIPDSVTKIGGYAFSMCSSLTSVNIPNSVTTLENGAFSGCSSLQEFRGKFATADGYALIVDYTLNSYANGCGLTEYTIPDNVTKIGYSAFYGCSSLTHITIPDSVTYIGLNAFQGCSNLKSVNIPDSVTTIVNNAFSDCSSLTSVNISNKVSCIAEGAFSGCISLTSITIPDSVTIIYDSAFEGCSNLTSVTIPNSVTTIGWKVFQYCSSLKDANIPNSVTAIKAYAFKGCSSLTSVTIPDSVTFIGADAFRDCSSLKGVYISDITAWCNIEFDGYTSANPLDNKCNLYLNNELVTDLTIPDNVTTITHNAFKGCSSLTSVTIPDSVTTIGDYAFYNCSNLTRVTIPDSVTTIGDGAFQYCSSLTSVNIPNSITTIDYSLFKKCTSLTSVTIPNSVTTIKSDAFCLCSNLTSVTFGNSINKVEDYAFSSCDKLKDVYISDITAWCNIIWGYNSNPFTYAHNLYLNNELVTDLIIPDSVTKIENGVFKNCTSLTSVTIPDSVTTIGNNAFWKCSSLTSVTIPDSVTTIGTQAFEYCGKLTSVTIPDSVTKIGSYAFMYCGNLQKVYCKAITPPTADYYPWWNAFHKNSIGRKIYVPAVSVEAYKEANGWIYYANDIRGYDFENDVVVE